jgi:hypothetical protein
MLTCRENGMNSFFSSTDCRLPLHVIESSSKVQSTIDYALLLSWKGWRHEGRRPELEVVGVDSHILQKESVRDGLNHVSPCPRTFSVALKNAAGGGPAVPSIRSNHYPVHA